jgi:hypothetical protein
MDDEMNMDRARPTLWETLTAATRGRGDAASSGTRDASLRRGRTREQGLALVAVGHAIEYLVDSRLGQQGPHAAAHRQALTILMQASLSIYHQDLESRRESAPAVSSTWPVLSATLYRH